MNQQAGHWYPGWHAALHAEHPAVIGAVSGETRTYGDLDAFANRTSRFLRAVGLQPGGHVAFWLDNEIDYPGLWWGARYAGLYYTLISTRLTLEEALYIVEDSGSGAVIVGRRLSIEHGDALAERVRAIGARLILGDLRSIREQVAAESPEPLSSRTEGMPMLYSSGTTGRPKAVKRPLTGAPLGSSPGAVGMARRFGMNEHTIYLSPAPLYHAAPLGYVSAVQALGGTVVLMEHFDAQEFLASVERYGVTHSQAVPTMFVRMLALPESVRSSYDLSSLRFLIHAGAPCPITVKRKMFEWLGPIIYEYYSGTENVGFTLCGPEEWLAHPGSVGRPIGSEVHIVGDDGAELEPGVDGDVYFSGSAGFEYHNDPEKTRSAYLSSGWATLGDIGHLDDDGYLYLTDRRANMIIVGGVNVYPQEAENVLAGHPLVSDVAVFGVPHPEWGEEVKAVVEPAHGVPADAALAAELIVYCRQYLASVKCPRSVDFSHDLPREPSGKLLKRKLRDEYRARMARENASASSHHSTQ